MDYRIDFYIEENNSKTLMEVKGVTLETDIIGYFSDVPTERCIKHLNPFSRISNYVEQYISCFVIQMPNVTFACHNDRTHKEFDKDLQTSIASGVKILYLSCNMTQEKIKIGVRCMPPIT